MIERRADPGEPHSSRAKRKVEDSLDALKDAFIPVSLWNLCLPVDPTATFKDRLTEQARRRGRRQAIWVGRIYCCGSIVDGQLDPRRSDLRAVAETGATAKVAAGASPA